MKVRNFIALSTIIKKCVYVYDRECVFLHEDAPICKYGGLCERKNCMFKHEELEEDKKESDVGDTINDDNQDEDETSDIESDEDNENKSDRTFNNPSQSDSSKSDAEPEVEYLTCDYCDFTTEKSDKGVLREHKRSSHNWCWVCDKKFGSKKKYKNHQYVIHSGNYKSMWD